MDFNSTFQISKIHENLALDPSQAQEVTGGTVSPGPEKPKISKCSVSNQISEEGCICLVRVYYGLISSKDTSKSDLFMTQVDFMHFFMFWVWLIHTLPSSVRWPPKSGILFPSPPNMYGKPKMRIHNPRNHFFSLILHLPFISIIYKEKK